MLTYLITWRDTRRSVRDPNRQTLVTVAPDWEPSPTTLADAPRIIATAHLGGNENAEHVLIVSAILQEEPFREDGGGCPACVFDSGNYEHTCGWNG
jgi:hypothetical protein